MYELAIELIALLVYAPLLVVLHELGHAVFARIGGYQVTSFGIGLGPPLWRLVLSGPIVVHVDRWLLTGGACIAIPNGPPTARRIWFHSGGLIFQAVLGLLLLAAPPHWIVDRLVTFNLLVAVTNAVPWRVGGNASDGWYILDAITGGRRTGNVLAQRGLFEQMSDREFAIGSPMGLAYADLCVTWADVLAGRVEEAAEFFEDDPPETAAHPWTDALYHYIKAEWHRTCARPLAALQITKQGRLALDPELGADAVALLAIAEARAFLALDEPNLARQSIQRVLASPLDHEVLPIELWASLDADTDHLQLTTWKLARNLQQPWLDPVAPVLALCAASEELRRRNKVGAAKSALHTAAEHAQATVRAAQLKDRRTLSYRLRSAIPSAVEPAIEAQPW